MLILLQSTNKTLLFTGSGVLLLIPDLGALLALQVFLGLEYPVSGSQELEFGETFGSIELGNSLIEFINALKTQNGLVFARVSPSKIETPGAISVRTYTLHDQIVGDVRGINEGNGVDHVGLTCVGFLLSDDNSLANGGFVGDLGIPNLLVESKSFLDAHGIA